MVAINKEKLLKNAQKFVAQGKLENAIREYEKILEGDPNDTTILNTIGDLNLHLSRTQTAINYFKRAAQKFIEDGFYGRGVALYRKIVLADSKNLENVEMLADLFIKEGVVSEAKKHYAEIGRAFLVQNNFSRAYHIFKKLADLTQDDANIHLKLAELSIKLEMLENARESYLNAALICSRKGQFQQGMNAIKMALEIDPHHMGSLKILFKISLELRDYQLLTEHLQEALTQSPDNREIMEMLGQCLMFQGNLQESFQTFDTIFREDENKYFLLFDLAESAYKMGEFKLAVEAIGRIIPILMRRKENLKAIEFLKALLEKDPTNTTALRELADVYINISDNFNYVTTLDKLAECLMRERDHAEALQVLEKVLGMDPGNEKYRKLHRDAFEKVYPNETYIPFGAAEDEAEEAEGGSLFEFDTTELSSGKAFTTMKESDAALEIELFLSYGLKDKAKNRLQEKIKEDPNDTVFREKLKNIFKEEGNLKQAAEICFQLVNILTLKGEHERAAAFMEEGRGLDPSRSDISIPTGSLDKAFSFPEEMDTSNTGFELIEIEDDAIDLSNDLSEILVGSVEDEPAPPKAATSPPSGSRKNPTAPPLEERKSAPEKRPPAEKPRPVEAPISDVEADINLRLEETLRSLQDLGMISPILLSDKPAKAAPPEEPAPKPEPLPALTDLPLVELNAPTPASKFEAPPVPVEDKSSALDKILENALREIDFYIKLGFNDNAREELTKLLASYPDHPEIQSRLDSLHPSQAAAPPGEPETHEEEAFPSPRIEIQEISRTRTPTAKEETAPEITSIEEIAAEDVNIDLFSMISVDSVKEETERPSSSYEARKNIPQIEESPVADQPKAPAGESPGLFGDLEADEVLGNSILFGEEKTSAQISAEGLFLPKDTDEEKASPAGASTDKNLSAMHNIFADIVEEANKVFVSDQEGEADFDTHYNLGIAYKEMGLLDDAISEFQKSYNFIKDQSNCSQYIQACHMLSLCFFEKGLYKSSIKWCERALNSKGHEDHEYQALRYDMAHAYEMMNEFKQALDLYAEIYAEDINYRDVSEKMNLIRKKMA
jgi:tetratricopeptide (TPR) repeat protein